MRSSFTAFSYWRMKIPWKGLARRRTPTEPGWACEGSLGTRCCLRISKSQQDVICKSSLSPQTTNTGCFQISCPFTVRTGSPEACDSSLIPEVSEAVIRLEMFISLFNRVNSEAHLVGNRLVGLDPTVCIGPCRNIGVMELSEDPLGPFSVVWFYSQAGRCSSRLSSVILMGTIHTISLKPLITTGLDEYHTILITT